MSESARKSDFKDKILPNLEVLLQFSLGLTKNGRDAVKLMREAMAEAYRSWDEPLAETSYRIWLHKILMRRFFNGFQRHSLPLAPNSSANIDESLMKNNRLFPGTTCKAPDQSIVAEEFDGDVRYFRAIAGLPKVFRSAMILSYLEGFSNSEIAELADVQPQAIESLLNRGRLILREELFAYLTGTESSDATADREMASG